MIGVKFHKVTGVKHVDMNICSCFQDAFEVLSELSVHLCMNCSGNKVFLPNVEKKRLPAKC